MNQSLLHTYLKPQGLDSVFIRISNVGLNIDNESNLSEGQILSGTNWGPIFVLQYTKPQFKE